MGKTSYPDCPCCPGPCCGLVDVPNTLYVTITECGGLDPTPVQIDLESSVPGTSKQWGGLASCDGGDCVLDFNLVCTIASGWVLTIQRDEGDAACGRCETTSDFVGVNITVTCDPLELVFTGLFFEATGCSPCDCDPLVGPITAVVTA